MKPTPTAQNFTDNPELVAPFLAKLGRKIAHEWNADDWGRGSMQTVLDEGIPATDIRAYSPVITEAQTQLAVPVSWPNSTIIPVITEEVIVPPVYDEETGEILEEGYTIPAEYGDERQKTWAEFTQALPVDGGFVLRYTASAMDENRNVRNLTTSQFNTWANRFNGFTTEAEYQAIKSEPVEP